MRDSKKTLATVLISLTMAAAARAEDRRLDYQVLSTSRISTMQKELNQAAASGYRFVKVTNTPNIFGGKELVVVTVKDLGAASDTRHYKVLSAGRSSSLQKKVQAAAREGYEYLEQTTMPNVFGGTDLVVILEKK